MNHPLGMTDVKADRPNGRQQLELEKRAVFLQRQVIVQKCSNSTKCTCLFQKDKTDERNEKSKTKQHRTRACVMIEVEE